MNEELIRQCAREWAAQDRERVASLMRTREAEADELTAADRYRRGVNDALLTREFELLRLYHARHVAPLERENAELNAKLRALVAELTEQTKRDGERIGQLEAKVAPLVAAAQEALSVVGSVNRGHAHRASNKHGGDGYLQTQEWCDWSLDEVAPKLKAALAPFQQEGK